jgi:hypothetical protein
LVLKGEREILKNRLLILEGMLWLTEMKVQMMMKKKIFRKRVVLHTNILPRKLLFPQMPGNQVPLIVGIYLQSHLFLPPKMSPPKGE